MRMRSYLSMVVGSALVLSAMAAAPAFADDGTVTASTLPTLLTTAADDTAHAYDRDLFVHWIDADDDGCSTRSEVLIDESTTPVTVGPGCSLTGGTWVSPYDDATWTEPSDVDIDHMVPLADAWRSGAWAWTAQQRQDYANDLGVPYALKAVTDNVNQSKSDRDPAQWMPPSAAYACQYLIDWALVKYRWSLTADPAETAALTEGLSGACGETAVTLPEVMIDPPVPSDDPDPAPDPDDPDPDPGTGDPFIQAFDAGVTRLSGSDRYQTAIAASGRYASGVPAVFVATGLNFPDALSAAAAASLVGGPLLLTPPTSLLPAVKAEIQRLAPQRIYVIGGTGAIGTAVERALARIAPVQRFAGADRYQTGLGIVAGLFPSATTAFIATGISFPDALAATGAAGAHDAPVILVRGTATTLDRQTMTALQRLGVTTVAIAGGTGAVTGGIESQLRTAGYAVTRYGGADRYATAAAINTAFFPEGSTDTLFLATGASFPDALAGAAMAGRLKAPLFVTTAACTPGVIHVAIDALDAPKRVVMGGTGVVDANAASNLGCLTSAAPSIGGTARVGSVLTAHPGAWTAGTDFAFQWYANGAAIGGATAATLTLPASTQGKQISVTVTGSQPGYLTVARKSAQTAAVGAKPGSTKPANPGDSKNCSDFATWGQAQAWFDTYYPYYGDIARLDADNDRIACESLPGAP